MPMVCNEFMFNNLNSNNIYIRAFFQLVALLGANEQHLLNSTLTLPKLRPPPTPFP